MYPKPQDFTIKQASTLILLMTFSLAWISGCAPSGVKIPSKHIIYQLHALPDGAAGWVCHKDLTVNNNGELCIHIKAPIYPLYKIASKNNEKGRSACLVVLKHDDKIYAFLPQEHKATMFVQGEVNHSTLQDYYIGINGFKSLDLAITTLEQAIQEGLMTEKLVTQIKYIQAK